MASLSANIKTYSISPHTAKNKSQTVKKGNDAHATTHKINNNNKNLL